MRNLPYYELHITVKDGDEQIMRNVLHDTVWTFSKITDDPIIGPGSKMYATCHLVDAVNITVVEATLNYMENKLILNDLNVIRAKIERVIYDDIKKPPASPPGASQKEGT